MPCAQWWCDHSTSERGVQKVCGGPTMNERTEIQELIGCMEILHMSICDPV